MEKTVISEIEEMINRFSDDHCPQKDWKSKLAIEIYSEFVDKPVQDRVTMCTKCHSIHLK